MKAPGIIYLTPLLVEGCGKSLSKRVTENDAVYIRKDLLLEWVKDNKENTGSLSTAILLQELIDKLNSL